MIEAPTIDVVVTGKERLTAEIASFTFRAQTGVLPRFEAGAHIDVHLAAGLTRQYSLCGDPEATDSFEIAVLLDPTSRGGSSAMHDLHPGDLLRIGFPRNHFPLTETVDRALLIAGGIGLTPMMAMAHRLQRLGRPFELHCCARSIDRAPFRERLARSDFAEKVRWHFSGDLPGGGRLRPEDVLRTVDPGTHLYVCGPASLIDGVLAAAKRLGWEPARVHHERFAASTGELDQAGDRPFEIEVTSLERTLVVPVGRSALQILHEHGVDVPVSCEQGLCGTCLGPVLSGIPDHRDTYLTDEERAANDQFTACCSRSRSNRLVLGI